MEIKEKSIWTSELIIGIIIGCILTASGTCVGIKLQQSYETKKNDRELGMKICEIINGNFYTANNVLESWKSSVFDDRWDTYIKQGHIPWLIHEKLSKKFIENKHNNLSDKFKKVDMQFKELHKLLCELRWKIKNHKTEDSIKETEDKIVRQINEIENIVEEINSQLYQF